MPTAPRKIPQVQVNSVGRVTQAIDAPDEAFGIGLGNAIQQGANTYADIQTKIKRDEDDALTNEALSEYRRYRLARTSEDDDAYLRKKGRDAVDGFSVYQQELEKERERISGTLSGRAQKNFDNLSRQHLDAGLESAARYRLSESEKWQNKQWEDALSVAQEEGAANYSDNSLQRQEIKDLIAVIGNKNDWTAEQRELKEKQILSGMHKTAIELMISNDQEGAANAYFRQAVEAGEIIAASEDDIRNSLKTSTENRIAMDARDYGVSEFLNKGKSLTEARAAIKERLKNDPEAQSKALAMIKEEYALKDAQLKVEQGQILDYLYTAKRIGGVAAVVEAEKNAPALFGKLTGEQQIAVYSKNAVQTDWGAYTAAEEAIDAGDFESKADIRAQFQGTIHPQQLKTLETRWEKRGQYDLVELRRIYSDFGYKPSTSSNPLTGDEAELWDSFVRYIDGRMEDARRPEDLRMWAAQFFRDGKPSQLDGVDHLQEKIGIDQSRSLSEAIEDGDAYVDEDGQIVGFTFNLPEFQDPNEILSITQSSGYHGLSAEAAFQRHVQPARYWLYRHDMPRSNEYVSALLLLKRNNMPITKSNIERAVRVASSGEGE